MAPLRPLPFREVLRKLQKAGFQQVSQRGSHVKLRSRDGVRIVIVPAHSDVPVGTLRSILRQAGLSTDDFGAL